MTPQANRLSPAVTYAMHSLTERERPRFCVTCGLCTVTTRLKHLGCEIVPEETLITLTGVRCEPSARISATLPLCVDLDGTLVLTDTLVEGILALVADRRLWWCIIGLLSGRAALKQRIAEAATIDVALLPFNQELLAYLHSQRTAGRTLVLATAADSSVAQAVADYLGLFDEVIGSDGRHNLKGAAKAAALVRRFGEKGFAYAGDSHADVPVWQKAQGAVLVNVGSRLATQLRSKVEIEAEFGNGTSRLRALLEAMRPHQWVKNLLVFVPIFTAHALTEWAAWSGALLVFAAFCATASGIYVGNDLMDLSADRRHPRKRLRPFARGALPLQHGAAFAVLLICLGAVIAGFSGALSVILAYAGISLAYSLYLKQQPLADVFTLAALYTIRLVGGGQAAGHTLSLWLLAFSTFLFLSLALMKRVQELRALGTDRIARRGYMAADEAILQVFGCASAFSASVVLTLYVQSETAMQQYRSPALLWAVVPLMLFWQCRLWLSTARGYMRDDPIVYAARDWVSWLAAGIGALLLIVAQSVSL